MIGVLLLPCATLFNSDLHDCSAFVYIEHTLAAVDEPIPGQIWERPTGHRVKLLRIADGYVLYRRGNGQCAWTRLDTVRATYRFVGAEGRAVPERGVD